MKVGTVFEHPTKDGRVVRLKVVKRPYGLDELCLGCVFGGNDVCESSTMIRDRNITGNCSNNEGQLMYVLEGYIESKIFRIMDAIRLRTGIHDLEFLESEIKTILEE